MTLRRFVVLVILAFGCGACDRLFEWSLGPGENLEAMIEAFGTSTRMVVKTRDDVKKDTTDPAEIAGMVAFFRRYPKGWLEVSGASGDYDVFLYEGPTLMWRVGFTAARTKPGEDSLNIGSRFRRVPQSDVIPLMHMLGLPWPIYSK